MEPYQIWAIAASSFTLVASGLGWLLGMIKSAERRIRDLEISLAVLEAIVKERGK